VCADGERESARARERESGLPPDAHGCVVGWERGTCEFCLCDARPRRHEKDDAAVGQGWLGGWGGCWANNASLVASQTPSRPCAPGHPLNQPPAHTIVLSLCLSLALSLHVRALCASQAPFAPPPSGGGGQASIGARAGRRRPGGGREGGLRGRRPGHRVGQQLTLHGQRLQGHGHQGGLHLEESGSGRRMGEEKRMCAWESEAGEERARERAAAAARTLSSFPACVCASPHAHSPCTQPPPTHRHAPVRRRPSGPGGQGG